KALHAELAAVEPQSARLVETYLDRGFPGWRDQADHSQDGARNAGSSAGGRMSREEAWQVLGLEPGGSDAGIHEADRRLVMNLQPDNGGSNYLASKIILARDVLLGHARAAP